MSEPSNPRSPWRLLPMITPTKVADDPYGDISKIPTTKQQRDYARKRLARIDALRLQQRKRNRKE